MTQMILNDHRRGYKYLLGLRLPEDALLPRNLLGFPKLKWSSRPSVQGQVLIIHGWWGHSKPVINPVVAHPCDRWLAWKMDLLLNMIDYKRL